MKNLLKNKLLLIFIMSILFAMNCKAEAVKQMLYNIVWGTIYNAEGSQCDDTPTITADGTNVDPTRASQYRYLAISQDMLFDMYRQSLVNDSTRFRGKISFGDTIYIYNEEYPEINGRWIVHDAMNKRHKMAIDFLQTKGDGHLYDHNKLWSGKFNNISIFKYVNKPKINKLDLNTKQFIYQNALCLSNITTKLLKYNNKVDINSKVGINNKVDTNNKVDINNGISTNKTNKIDDISNTINVNSTITKDSINILINTKEREIERLQREINDLIYFKNIYLRNKQKHLK